MSFSASADRRPIAAVGTGTAGFVGNAPDPAARVGEAVAVNSWAQFSRDFVGRHPVKGTPLARALHGFFDNGGTRCFVVNIPAGRLPAEGGLALLADVDEIAILAAPGHVDEATQAALLHQCGRRGDRVAILDSRRYLDQRRIRQPGPGMPRPAVLRPPPSSFGALYGPWLVVRDPVTEEVVTTPPSGHVAGVWARTDSFRSPGDEPLRGTLDLTDQLTHADDAWSEAAGLNQIRFLPGEGVRLRDARTLASTSDPLGQIRVRRLYAMVQKSVAAGTRWAAFEPNDSALWRSVRRDVGAFLGGLWRGGAFVGRTEAESFFVRCDEDTNAGEGKQVVALIGIAPVTPGEFLVFRLTQSMSGPEIDCVPT